MISVLNWGNYTKLNKAITRDDTTISVPYGDGRLLKLGSGEHFYLTLRNGSQREVVKVVAKNGDLFTVERGQDGTTAKDFGRGTCLSVEWNPAQLCEYVHSCVQGCTNIKPQSFVVGCGTSIEVNACGNIIAVNGSEKC